MAPRTQITTTSQRPTDPAFAYSVRFYEPKRGVRVMWTDSREYAAGFAAAHRCYAKPAVVQVRADWELGRRIGLSESARTVVT
ncbi:MAG TPA: hypothetical protein VGJ84_09930 [Polyangiaceae bacterium]